MISSVLPTTQISTEIFAVNTTTLSTQYSSIVAQNVDPASQIQSSEPLMFVYEFTGNFELTYSGTMSVEVNFDIGSGVGTTNIFSTVEARGLLFVNGVNVQTESLWTNTIQTTSLTNSYSATFNMNQMDVFLNVSDFVTFEVQFILTNCKLYNVTAKTPTMEFNVSVDSSTSLDLSYSVQETQPDSIVKHRVHNIAPSL